MPSVGRLLDETGEFTERTRKRYDDTALLTTFYPRPVRPLVRLFSRSIMDAPLREAFGYAVSELGTHAPGCPVAHRPGTA